MSKQVKAKKKRLTFGQFLANNSVPIMFIIFCAICIPISGFSPSYLLNEIVTRMGRNTFLILCLLIPIMAGMGLNFGMTLGAMAGEIALIFVSDWQIWGIPGVVLAMILSIPISILLGAFCGSMLNRARGREMITSYIISFFINGVYQLVVLYMMGSIIPIQHSEIKLPRHPKHRELAQHAPVHRQPACHQRKRREDPRSDVHPDCASVPVHHLVPQDQARTGHARGRSGHGGRA